MKQFINKTWGILLTCASFYALTVSNAPAYDVVTQATDLNNTVYTQPPAGAIEHYLFSTPAASSLPALQPGQSMLVKILAPAGTTSVSIRGESLLWTGASGPVVATFSDAIPESCPSFVGGIYVCGDVPLTIPTAGLSHMVYRGVPLSQARYMYLVMRNGDSRTFTFGSLTATIKIGDIAAYKTWLSVRPWAGGASTNSMDGIGESIVITPTIPACSSSIASLLSKVNADLSIEMPYVNINSLGMGDYSAKLIYQRAADGSHTWKLGPLSPLNCILP